ncbi:MAG: WD40/YVTN/BNR-like repeat-containing protein [Planctomycetota bacterium]|jgi:photosystem II stability/assembly factor-like uncharacterized protein
MTRIHSILPLLVAAVAATWFATPAPAQCTWEIQHEEPGDFNELFDIAFWADGQRGLAVGTWGRVFRTTDAGQTWTQTQAGIGDKYSIALLEPDFAVVGGEYSEVYISHDAGLTWTQAPGQWGSGEFEELDFVSETEGWAVLQSSTLLHTNDAGVTWQSVDLPGNYILDDIDFIDANTGWAIGPRDLMWKTTDGGVTWEEQFLPPHWFPISSGTPQEIRMVNDQVGWITAARGYIVYTADGGNTWQLQENGFPWENLEPYILPLSETEVWAVDFRGRVRHTADRGVSWQEIDHGFDFSLVQWFRAIWATDSGHIWFVGRNDMIVHRAPTPAPHPADLNDDCVVTLADLCYWAEHPVDLNGDGQVTDGDAELLAAFIGDPFEDCNANFIPDTCEEAVFYRHDNLGGSSAGMPAGDAILMMRYVVPPGVGDEGETINAVEWVWGWEMQGVPVDIGIWDDPTNDGDPSDAVLLLQQPVLSPAGEWQEAQLFDVPPTFVGHRGDYFFVGIRLLDQTNEGFWLPFDNGSGMNSTWWAVGDDMENIGANPLLHFLDGENWPIRALGTGLYDADGDGLYDQCEPPPVGDLDGDGDVDFGDILIVIGSWGPCAGACPADLDGSGAVDFGDILIVIANWG